jgi:bisphosphoglycerate-dependent phosphoglycerate mutase
VTSFRSFTWQDTGETAWTLSGQHTGLTDLPLTERGERNARRLEERLRGLSFAKVFTSPLQRASAPVSWPALELWLKSTGFGRMELWRV